MATNRRQGMECASPLALSSARRTLEKRRRTGAVQDVIALEITWLGFMQWGIAAVVGTEIHREVSAEWLARGGLSQKSSGEERGNFSMFGRPSYSWNFAFDAPRRGVRAAQALPPQCLSTSRISFGKSNFICWFTLRETPQ